MLNKVVCGAVFWGLLGPCAVYAEPATGATLDAKQVGFLLKALTYDRNAEKRYDGEMKLLVVYADEESLSAVNQPRLVSTSARPSRSRMRRS